MEPVATKKRARAAEHLQALYTVAAGLALAVAVSALESDHDAQRTELFLAFVITVVPFYHGTQRFLDDEYRFGADTASPRWALLFDFSLLFAEACALIALASTGASADHFAVRLVILLLIDIAWNVFGGAVVRREQASPMWEWAKVNGPTVLVALFLAALLPRAVPLLVVALTRTLFDYGLNLDWYVGEDPSNRVELDARKRRGTVEPPPPR